MTSAFPIGYRRGSETWLTSADGVRLRAVHLEPPGSASRALGVVLAHGFGGGLDSPALAGIATGLSDHAGVLALDLRGHGGSAGHSTMGAEEVLDIDAAVLRARALGYARVVTVGFSMGGSAVLRQAGLLGVRTTAPVDAVVSVSSPSRWFRTETAPMRRLHLMVTTAIGRRLARIALGVRVDPAGWPLTPSAPEQVIGRITPTPVLVVHGEHDPYLTPDNGPSLFEAASEPRELWQLPGFGHAEAGMTPALVDRLGRRLLSLTGLRAA